MNITKFEKVSLSAFKNACNDLGFNLNNIEEIYQNIQLPKRATKGPARGVPQRLLRHVVGGVHPAHRGLRGHLPRHPHGAALRHLHHLSGGGHGGHPHGHHLRRLRGPVLPDQAHQRICQ